MKFYKIEVEGREQEEPIYFETTRRAAARTARAIADLERQTYKREIFVDEVVVDADKAFVLSLLHQRLPNTWTITQSWSLSRRGSLKLIESNPAP